MDTTGVADGGRIPILDPYVASTSTPQGASVQKTFTATITVVLYGFHVLPGSQ